MAFCQNCGSQLREGERFCTNCGAQVTESQQGTQQQAPHTPPAHQAPPQQPAHQPQAPQYGAAQPSHMQQSAAAAGVAGGAAVGAMGGSGAQPPHMQSQASAPINPYAAPPQPQPPYQQGAAAGAGGAQKETIKEMFLTTQGRLNRKPYILRGLFLWILSLVTSGVMDVMTESDSLVMNLLSLVVFVLFIALGVATIMLVIRRWHDLGKSGWFTLLLFIPLVNLFVALYLWVKKGDEGPNEYGDDPLA